MRVTSGMLTLVFIVGTGGCFHPPAQVDCEGPQPDPECGDGGDVSADSGARATDAGPISDAGAAPSDGGTSALDAGPSSPDAGTAPVDAGAAPLDAGATPPDAGPLPPDAGVPGAGAGATPDAGGCVPVPAGLVGWWRGEGNAQDQTGRNHGVASTGVTYTSGRVGLAFRFDGLNGVVTTATSGFPTGSADRTLEAWVRVEAFLPDECFFAGYGLFGTDSATYQLGAIWPTGQPYFSQWGHSLLGPTLTPQRWTHIAVTTQGGLTILYIDGALAGAGALTLNTPAGTALNLGRVSTWLGSTRRLQGGLDEVAVYDRALSASEIGVLAGASLGKCP